MINILISLTLSVEFKREIKMSNLEEIVEGKLYYQNNPYLTILEIQKPINQIIIVKDSQTLIYYPNENKSIKIKTQNPLTLYFLQSLIENFLENNGLVEKGYMISHYERKNDTLSVYFNPPPNLSHLLGQAKLVYIQNKLRYLEARNSRNIIINKVFYDNHIKYGNIYYPLKIYGVLYIMNDSITELLTFKNLNFNIALPEIKIPSNVNTTEIKW